MPYKKKNQKLSEFKSALSKREKELEETKKKFKRIRDEWEIRLRYSRRGLEVTNRELAKTNSLLATANKELEKVRAHLEERVRDRTKQLEEEKNKTLAIINNFADGLLFFDNHNRLFLINPKAKLLFNIRTKDAIEKSFQELSQSSKLFKSLWNLLKHEVKEISREELSTDTDSTLEVTTILVNSDREKTGTLVILHDITREKAVEKMKSDFVSIAAHQLRTPLSATKWVFSMVLQGDFGPISKKQLSFLKKGHLANERMIRLVNNLLDVSRIEEKKLGLKFTNNDFIKLLKKVVNDLKTETTQQNINIKLHAPKSKLVFSFDRQNIKIVLYNLINNAIRYNKAKGNIIISVNTKKQFVEISIEDAGVGIPKNQQERVFSKFFRGTNVVRMQTEGTGLGLYFAKHIVEKHGGQIWFKSKENKGSIFYFTLPNKLLDVPARKSQIKNY